MHVVVDGKKLSQLLSLLINQFILKHSIRMRF